MSLSVISWYEEMWFSLPFLLSKLQLYDVVIMIDCGEWRRCFAVSNKENKNERKNRHLLKSVPIFFKMVRWAIEIG